MNELLGTLRSFGPARLAIILGVTIGAALAMGLVIARIGAPSLGILYADLDYAEAQDVLDRLQQDGVDHQIRESGGRITVLAPRDDMAKLRLALAADGVVAGRTVGYEIFDQTDAFGATTFQQNINRLRALEGELARTIASIDGVRSARVHLVLPERELFARDRKEASASIVVDAPRGVRPASVRAIVNLAASAVEELSPGNITVLDVSGDLLAAGDGDADSDAAGMGVVEDRVAATEARLRRTVEEILGRIVGPENLRVQVAADMDFGRITESSEIIDPDSQTVLSATIVEERSNDVDPAASRGVSVGNALPEASVVDPALQAAPSTSARTRTEETTNYELTRTVRQEVREAGRIERLSVAVAVNALEAPRTEEELTRLTALVRTAVGFDSTRGDRVEVVEMSFVASGAPPTAAPTVANAPALNSADVMRLAEVAALALIALAVAFFIIRPLIMTAAQDAETITRPASVETEAPKGVLAPPETPALEQKIDLSRVEGQVNASSLKQVSEVVKNHTDASAGILKNWIREAS